MVCLEDVDFLCRLCLSTSREQNNEFSENCEYFKRNFSIIFNIEVDPKDETWKYVCNRCYIAINDFYVFHKQVLENYNKYADLVVIKADEDCKVPPDLYTEQIKACEIVEVENKNDRTTNIEGTTETEPEHLNARNNKKTPRIPKKQTDETIKAFLDFTCTLCKPEKIEFATFKDMQLHYQNNHDTRGFVICCNKKIYRKDRVLDHITLHTNPNAFRCTECGQTSKSRVLLRIHMKQHLPIAERPFQCSKCDQRFVLRSQLTNHEASHLTDEQKKNICDECGKAFALKFVLLKHKQTHKKEKLFFCEVCAKSFSSKGNLAFHLKQHSDKPEPRVQCTDCGQWYKNIQTYRTHIYRHKDAGNHNCKICNKKFSSKSSLSSHIRYVHEKVSQYECNICEKQFRRKLELTEHLARHTGEVLYTCKYCPKTFTSSSNFFAHRKNRHPREYATLNQSNVT